MIEGNGIAGAAAVAVGLTVAALLLALVRLIRGPTLADRVVALDLLGTVSIGVIAAYDVLTEQPVLLDVATVLALVAFLGTVALARYIRREPI